MNKEKETRLQEEVRHELLENILPFWLKLRDPEFGGFYGRVDGENRLHPDSDKGAIYMSRILWTFSRAYRLFRNPDYLLAATEARDFILNHMIDPLEGGIYWKVDRQGNPTDGKKQIYAQGFAIYGLSEYYRATGDPQALDEAIRLFRRIEGHAWDPIAGGYLEAFTQSWGALSDMRLSDKDDNEPKTMNTHLHILEPYTNLLRAWDNELLRTRLKDLINLFFERIVDKVNNHCSLFFDMDWTCKSNTVSYGHDIEACWLLHDALDALGDKNLTSGHAARLKAIAAAAAEGIAPDGSLFYERDLQTGATDMERHWWVQAENILGNYLIYKWYKDETGLDRAIRTWHYVQDRIIDTEQGEWYWSRRADGTPNRMDDKAGFWKCPYHNGRMAMILNEP